MPDPVLAIDIGGSKILAALVAGGTVLDTRTIVTERALGADAWCDAVARLAEPWAGDFERIGAALSGIVVDGCWHALNPDILPVPDGFPIVEALAARLGRPALAINDAQAAAWGEYRFGAGEGRDLVYLTVSTGIGGGIVLGGRLLTGRWGLAGHFGQLRSIVHDTRQRLEDSCGGQALARAAHANGHDLDAQGVFAASAAGEPWAEQALGEAASRLARLCADIQLALDPALFVIGGGVGLADGYLDRVRAMVAGIEPRLRPEIRSAALGAHAGAIGVADLAAGGGRLQPKERECTRH